MSKVCPSDKILNPVSNRCVSKVGKIGKKLLASSHQKEKKVKHGLVTEHSKPCPEDKILNPVTNRCVSRTGKIGKKVVGLSGTEKKDVLSKAKKETPKPKSSKKDLSSSPPSEQLLDVSSWKKLKPDKTGSNPAKLYFDPHGQKYYGKTYKVFERMETENLASKLYNLVGVDAVETCIAKDKKNFILLQKWIDNLRLPKSSDMARVRKGFLVDAWLANWDAPMNDNIMIQDDGRPIRLDVGGSLDYRAKGSKKQTTRTPFGEQVGQLNSLRKRGPYVDFKKISKEELQEQVEELRKVSDKAIRETVFNNVRDKERAEKLFNILSARRQFILLNI